MLHRSPPIKMIFEHWSPLCCLQLTQTCHKRRSSFSEQKNNLFFCFGCERNSKFKLQFKNKPITAFSTHLPRMLKHRWCLRVCCIIIYSVNHRFDESEKENSKKLGYWKQQRQSYRSQWWYQRRYELRQAAPLVQSQPKYIDRSIFHKAFCFCFATYFVFVVTQMLTSKYKVSLNKNKTIKT